MNNSSRVLGLYELSSGGITGTVVDLRLIFATALETNATAIIMVHNHLSGKLIVSKADLSIN
jgi:DNA repair protein RadC